MIYVFLSLVVNQQSLVERLEVIARQLGMSYTPPTATESRLFLSAEMFIVEILPDGHGGVKDVKIGHHDSSVVRGKANHRSRPRLHEQCIFDEDSLSQKFWQ